MYYLCITGCRWPGQVIRIIVIVVVAALAVRWAPHAVLPLIVGISLGAWLLVGLLGGEVTTR